MTTGGHYWVTADTRQATKGRSGKPRHPDQGERPVQVRAAAARPTRMNRPLDAGECEGAARAPRSPQTRG